jgi:predicted transcriptional regulator
MRKDMFLKSIDVSTRPKRRRAMSIAVGLLGMIRAAEIKRVMNMPDNLRDGEQAGNAKASVYIIEHAIDILSDAY